MLLKVLSRCLLASSLLVGSSAFAAYKSPAKSGPASSNSNPVYTPVTASGSVGSWVYRCTFKGDALSAGPQNCVIQQELAVQQKGQRPVPLGMVVFARTLQNNNQKSLADRPWHFVIVAPEGLSLQKQPRVSSEHNQPINLSWENCTNSGCVASADLTTQEAKNFQQDYTGNFFASRVEGTNELKISFSLVGLSMAMDRVQDWIDHPSFH